ncbi:hypothetical protein [Oryzobacter telluris]|uniref:hypothetical protein n=1 Tax=Oryzobacter telluris TaxID=3149179 RepID=UPI00370D9F05
MTHDDRPLQSGGGTHQRGLGDIREHSHDATAPIREAQMEAAANLLEKAFNALRDGDEDRARRLAHRAATLPYDEEEHAQPGAFQVHMMMFMVVTDELEEVGGHGWLDAALEALATAPEHGRFTMRDCLVAIEEEYDLSPDERRRIRASVAHVPGRPELHELGLEGERLTTALLDVLRGVIAFEDALD